MQFDKEIYNRSIKEIANEVPLDKYEEIELIKKAQAGDTKAKDKVIKANMKFCISYANKICKPGFDLNDIISETYSGMLTAINHFDANKDTKFIFYAVWWMKQCAIQYMKENGSNIRIPNHVFTELSDKIKGKKQTKNQINRLNSLPSVESYNVVIKHKNSGELVELKDVLRVYDEDQVNLVDNDEFMDEVKKIIKNLDVREADIIDKYYGITTGEPISLNDIATIYNLTLERVRQIKKAGIKKIRNESHELVKFINN